MKPSHLALLAATFILSSSAWRACLKDDTGQEVRLKAPAKRIVTLAPHIAESLFAAGPATSWSAPSITATTRRKRRRCRASAAIRASTWKPCRPEAGSRLAWESGNNMPQVAS
jgi:iron complex transport system substrate-binding protein